MEHLGIADQLHNWTLSIQLDKKEAAHSIYEKLNKHIVEYDTETLAAYFLIESRYHTIVGNLQESRQSLAKAREYEEIFTELQHYKLFFAEGFIYYYEKQYQDAIATLEKAEKYMIPSMEPAEIGEFHLIKAMVYYFLDITSLSAVHAAKAVENFKTLEPLSFLLARTELVLGMNHLDMSDYETAEKHLLTALSTCKKIKNYSLLASANLNLGVLYVTRGLPATAIRYLEDALAGKQKRIELNVLFLLADSYWKTNQAGKAMQAYSEGFQKSLDRDNTKMKWEFAMLHKKYEDRDNFEIVWKEGIEYFRRVNDKYNVRTYSKELAQYYTDKKQYEHATTYYLLALI